MDENREKSSVLKRSCLVLYLRSLRDTEVLVDNNEVLYSSSDVHK